MPSRFRARRSEDDPYQIYCKCFLCDRDFPFGQGRYDGRYLPHYKISVCDKCLKANWDGVGPTREEKIVKHLQETNIPIKRNAKGWIPLEES
jgi:hypothetical protein